MKDKVNENPLDFWEGAEKARIETESARERFRVKSYYEEWQGVKTLSHVFAAILPAISLATAISYVSSVFQVVLPAYVAMLIAFVLIAGWELAKSRLLILGFTLAYKRSRAAYGVLLLCLALAAGSAYTSLKGAENAFNRLDNRVSGLQALQAFELDSVTAQYAQSIAREDSAKSSYVNAVSWRGRVDVSNSTTKAVLAAHTAEIARLRDERSSALGQLKASHELALSKARKESGYSIAYVLAAVAIVEVLIVLCNWYLVFFQYRVNAQRELIEQNMNGRTIAVSPSKLADFVGSFVLPQYAQYARALVQSADGPESERIGFEVGSGSHSNSNHAHDELERDRAYLVKHSAVVQAIREGYDEQAVLRRTGIGRTTYYNVKRCMSSTAALNPDVEPKMEVV